MAGASQIDVQYVQDETGWSELDGRFWSLCSQTRTESDWNGKKAVMGRSFEAGVLWSSRSLLVFFDAGYSEPLCINENPALTEKTVGLWERDVCEVFIAPDKNEPREYFEFEVAPTGEWLDLAIDLTSGERVTDWDYESGMEATARIKEGRVLMAMMIPWEAFGKKPKVGDVWLGNIVRCVGKEPDRGYLAWKSTMTEKPNFHVPEAFGEFIFLR